MKIPRVQMETYFSKATATEKEIMNFIMSHPQKAIKMDIHSLAAACYCSSATLVRLCQKLGFKGFREFKEALGQELAALPRIGDVLNQKVSSKEDVCWAVVVKSMKDLYQTSQILSHSALEKTVEVLDQAHGIYTFGIGASYLVIEDFAMKCLRISKPVYISPDIHQQIVMSASIQPGQVCIVVSYSGQTREILQIARNIRQRKGILVALTQSCGNDLASMADYVLHIPSSEPQLRSGASSSRLCFLMVIDMIYALLLEKNYENNLDSLRFTRMYLEKEEPLAGLRGEPAECL